MKDIRQLASELIEAERAETEAQRHASKLREAMLDHSAYKDAYAEAVRVGARWWAQYLRTDGPKAEFDLRDPVLTAYVKGVRDVYAETQNRDDDFADRFEKAFIDHFMQAGPAYWGHEISVNYHPRAKLEEIITLAGGDPKGHHGKAFPIKTTMVIYAYKVVIRESSKTIWSISQDKEKHP